MGLITQQELDKRLSDKIDQAYNSLKSAEMRSSSLQRGMQVIHADQTTPLQLKKIEGKTVVNLAPTFYSGLWRFHNNVVVNAPNKITLNATDNHQESVLQSIPVKPSTTYTISASTNGRYYVRDLTNDTPIFAHTDSDGNRYMTFTTANNTTEVSIHLSNHTLGEGTYTFENIMLNEGSEPQEYVDGIKNLSGVYIKRYGNNLLPPFYEWEINSEEDVTIHDSYSATIRTKSGTTSGAEGIRTFVSVIPGEKYSLSAKGMSEGGRIRVSKNNSSGFAGGTFINELNGGIEESITFTIPEDTDEVVIAIIREADASYAGVVFDVRDVMLNYGDEPLPFEPQDNDYLVTDVELASRIDGSNPEILELQDGRYWKIKKYNQIVLDGSLPWAFSASFSGYKRVGIPASTELGIAHSQIVIKNNGRVLTNHPNNNFTSGDQVVYNPNYEIAKLQLSISNEDSGWGNNYTPTPEEIKAYFNGWKMHTVGNRASVYDGTGRKGWYPITRIYDTWDPSYAYEDDVPQILANNKESWSPYLLQYELQNPVLEDVTNKVFGSVVLYEGDSLIEVGEGIVVREKNTPVFRASQQRWYINNYNDTFTDNPLKYRLKEFVKIYRNGVEDLEWQIQNEPNFSYGRSRAFISSESFNQNSIYEVTYIAESWSKSSYIQTVNVEYATNITTALDRTIQKVTDLETRVSEIPKIYAKKHHNPLIITPTLINGWSTSASQPVIYYKDQFGYVYIEGYIYNANVTDQLAFILIEGYRPSRPIYLGSVSADSKGHAVTQIDPSGRVYIELYGGAESTVLALRYKANN